MRVTPYSGYPVTLHSPLNTEECLRWLRVEFYDRRGREQHATSDTRRRGAASWEGFIIYASLMASPAGRNYKKRIFRIRFEPNGTGTRIVGSYGYARADDALLADTFRTIAFVVGGLIAVLLGLIGLVAALARRELAGIPVFGGLVPIGVLMMLATFYVATHTGDDDLLRERDDIARYLEQIPDATVVGDDGSTRAQARPIRR